VPLLIVQQGHCYRTTGATGTIGEQGFATDVGETCFRLLDGRGGWSVRRTLADQDAYNADAFVAIHCDGSINTTARGASVGYRTPEGQRFAQDWKRAYAARGWQVFRPDNYTTALAGYYGVRRAVAAGTRRAMIVECGFLTNPTERAILTSPGGAERAALAIGDALGITQGEDMDPAQNDTLNALAWRTHALINGLDAVPDRTDVQPPVVRGEQMWFVQLVKRLETKLDHLTADLAELKARPVADVDEAALAAELEARGFDGATAAEVTEAIRAAFARAGQPEGSS
jgi:hypothetical protein